MISLLDGPLGTNDWATIDWEKMEITYDESDGRIPISTSQCRVERGKYAGYLLSEVSDKWYLQFIKDKNPDDAFISLMFGRRIKELE